MVAVRHLGFLKKLEILTAITDRRASMRNMPNIVLIGQSVAKIRPFSGWRPPAILNFPKFKILIRDEV